jgi:hypothetical protein
MHKQLLLNSFKLAVLHDRELLKLSLTVTVTKIFASVRFITVSSTSAPRDISTVFDTVRGGGR